MINHVQLNFELFVAIWNNAQGQTTPPVHSHIARWLNKGIHRNDKRLLLMAFRSCGKSTLVGLFCAWALWRNPNRRILVLAADSVLAGKMVRNVKRIIEKHPLTAALKPAKADQWANDRFTVVRSLESRDPSMQARGIDANITGSRADMIICDDVEVPATSSTPEARHNLREALAETDFILTPRGMVLYIGTPHSYDSIYADEPNIEMGQTTIFLPGYHRLKVPIMDENGHSVWPERFPADEIERMQRRIAPNKFASQMMLLPVSIHESRLDAAALRRYGHELRFVQANGVTQLFLGDKRLLSCSCWWDPAFAREGGKGDSSVIAVVFTDADGNYYLHGIHYLSHSESGEGDAATQQCRQVADFLQQNFIPSVSVEINGIGRFLPQILRRQLVRENVRASVVEKASKTAKDGRILSAFETVLAARMLYVHEAVYQTPFIREMREWRPGMKGAGVDDGLDAVAGAILSEPVRIGSGSRVHGGAQVWQRGQGQINADIDFTV